MGRLIAFLTSGLLVAGSGVASAQVNSWNDRGFFNVSFGATGGSGDLVSTLNFELNQEQAEITSTQPLDGGGFFDLMAGARLWKNLGAGFSFSSRSTTSDAAFNASIPDPIEFDRFRQVSGTTPGRDFGDTTFALLLVAGFRVTEKIDAIAFIGPAFRNVDADLLDTATVEETSDELNPSVTPTYKRVSETLTGVQIGVDLRYMFTPTFGGGGFLRYSGGGGDLADGARVGAPGVQVGFGLRVRF